MKIEIEITGDNEATAYPWWVIVNPMEHMKKEDAEVDMLGDSEIAFAITGPFFSREEAENHLTARRYAFSKGAVVWCLSGHATTVYRNAINKVGATDGVHVYR
jgi:hypothetical protein